MAPEALELLLAGLPPEKDDRLLLGHEGHEDATVIRVPEGMALVQTVDFLSPLCNDPYIFGQIAAANALSDVYAMGGEPWSAMNVACFPTSCEAAEAGITPEALAAILRGGLDKVHEAGAVLAGGHTVQDEDLKYGLAVTGIIDPDNVASNHGLKPGDQLLLTKPLGTGILATAVKAEWDGHEVAEADLGLWAARLNKAGGRVIRELRLKAATDITGFGLGGHSLEMARASKVTVELSLAALPLLPQVKEYAAMGLIPGGSWANRRFCEPHTHITPDADPLMLSVLFDAQTSGGLLLAVPGALVEKAVDMLAHDGEPAWHVGSVKERGQAALCIVA